MLPTKHEPVQSRPRSVALQAGAWETPRKSNSPIPRSLTHWCSGEGGQPENSIYTLALREWAAAPLSRLPGVQGTTEAQLHAHGPGHPICRSTTDMVHLPACLLWGDLKVGPLKFSRTPWLTYSDLPPRATCQRLPGISRAEKSSTAASRRNRALSHAQIWGHRPAKADRLFIRIVF